MKQIKNYTICKESYDDMRDAGRWNPSLEITFKDKTGIHTHKLSAGYQDDIHVYRESGETFVLTTNPYLGYIGLEVFKGSDKVSDIFLEDYKLPEIPLTLDLAPFTIIKRLEPYLAT